MMSDDGFIIGIMKKMIKALPLMVNQQQQPITAPESANPSTPFVSHNYSNTNNNTKPPQEAKPPKKPKKLPDEDLNDRDVNHGMQHQKPAHPGNSDIGGNTHTPRRI